MKQPLPLFCIKDDQDVRPPQLSLLVDMDRPRQVFREVQTIACLMVAETDLRALKTLFEDILKLFDGRYPGYQACNTGYHNLKHTTDTTLAMARLMHGSHVGGLRLSENHVVLGLMAALFHDVGYIQEKTDHGGTGAKLSSIHIQRGIKFMTHYLQDKGYPSAAIQVVEKAIQCTDLERTVDSIPFQGAEEETTGKMLAASDLLAQTADRNYLEKLPLLLEELKEAGINDFQTEFDFFEASVQFNQKMAQRLEKDLSGVNRFFAGHFSERWHLDRDLYQESIDNSMKYLTGFLARDGRNYRLFLRRRNGV